MKRCLFKTICLFIIFVLMQANAFEIYPQDPTPGKIKSLSDSLNVYIERTDNSLFKLHCESILRVMQGKSVATLEAGYLYKMYDAFTDTADPYCPADVETYLQRRRPFIFSWISPSDGSVSLSWLKPPRNYQAGTRYPLYVELHGLWNVASNAFQYMSYPFTEGPSYNNAFEDGFVLSPWGRGNYWYQGSSETDILECMDAFMEITPIDSSRLYLCGHSMGGYGAMCIAAKTSHNWAALGIYAGALWYNPSPLNYSTIHALKDVPTYFICGTSDNLIDINREAYDLLAKDGNKNLCFNTFNGGHEYREGDVFTMYMWMRKFSNDQLITQTKNEIAGVFSYTNPVRNTLYIKSNGTPGSAVSSNIYDLSGKLVFSSRDINMAGDGSYTLDLGDLSPGTYILQVMQSDKIRAGILIKQ